MINNFCFLVFFTRVIDGNRKLTANQHTLNHGHERKAVFGNAHYYTILTISTVYIMHTEHSMWIFYMHEIHGWPSISSVSKEPEIISTAFVTTFIWSGSQNVIHFNKKKLEISIFIP